MASFNTLRQSRRLQAPSARTAALIQPRSSPSIARMRMELENEHAPHPNAAENT